MALKAGAIHDFSNSMAEAIENAFIHAWPDAMGNQPAPPTNTQMQLLYVAIAEGVLRHLADHPEAFIIQTTYNGSNFVTGISQIVTS